MREWSLIHGDPLYLVLAADASLVKTSYVDDHIWSIQLRSGDPPALGLATTFGLRARNFRLFPRFTEAYSTVSDPQEFNTLPIIRHIQTNYISLEFAPFLDINVVFDVWVPESNCCYGSITLENNGNTVRNIELDLVTQLSTSDGERMAPHAIEGATILAGKTANLVPILFVVGGATIGAGTYPALSMSVKLLPGKSVHHAWAIPGSQDQLSAFELARVVVGQNWDAAIARLDVFHSGKLEIFTGNPDWDAGLAASARLANNLLVGPTEYLPHKSFVYSRNPDQGFSIIGDGSDYDLAWRGQTPFENYFLTDILLPHSLETCKELLKNFLFRQRDDGFVSNQPGLSTNRSNILATPILATTALKISEFDPDIEFLTEIYDGLYLLLNHWFTPMNDRDEDGIPEWSHVQQTGIEDNPFYSNWKEGSLGMDIRLVESPSLGSLLLMECKSLRKIANFIQREENMPQLDDWTKRLEVFLDHCWNPEYLRYMDRDRETHSSPQHVLLGQITGPGKLPVRQSYAQKQRLIFYLHTEANGSRQPEITIHGKDAGGKFCTHRISADKFNWFFDRGFVTSEETYNQIEWIRFENILPQDRLRVMTATYQQNSLAHFLPLWAGIPDIEKASKMIETSLLNPDEFLTENGLSIFSRQDRVSGGETTRTIFPIWHLPILEGMLTYGYRREAARIFTLLSRCIIDSLKSQNCFRRNYDGITGSGTGERNHLNGIMPVGLFLRILGVKAINSKKVYIEGQNPFPWSVTVRYKGTSIHRQNNMTTVVFANGKSIDVENTSPCMITLDEDKVQVVKI